MDRSGTSGCQQQCDLCRCGLEATGNCSLTRVAKRYFNQVGTGPKWKCLVCHDYNDSSASTCGACGTPSPNAAAGVSIPGDSNPDGPLSSDLNETDPFDSLGGAEPRFGHQQETVTHGGDQEPDSSPPPPMTEAKPPVRRQGPATEENSAVGATSINSVASGAGKTAAASSGGLGPNFPRSWVCVNPLCGTVNESTPFCTQCSSRFSGLKPWHCLECDAPQQRMAARCNNCHADRPVGWSCGCGRLNSIFSPNCVVCGQQQQSAKCAECGGRLPTGPSPPTMCPQCFAPIEMVKPSAPHSGPVGHSYQGAAPATRAPPPPETRRQPVPSHPGVHRKEDWLCTKCGTHNFGKRLACFQCSSPRPIVTTPYPKSTQYINSSAPPPERPSNWSCGLCGCENPVDRKFCQQCMEPQPEFVQVESAQRILDAAPAPDQANKRPPPGNPATGQRRSGDWFCSSCNADNFSGRIACFRCGVGLNPNPTAAKLKTAKPGDWLCPKPGCGTLNFMHRDACWLCATPRGIQMTPGAGPGATWTCATCKRVNDNGRSNCVQCRTSRLDKIADGDWACDKCQYVNFAKRPNCNGCGAAKKRSTKWRCTCGALADGSTCPDCGATRRATWPCPSCTTENDDELENCGKCDAPKPVEGSTVAAPLRPGVFSPTRGRDGSKGNFAAPEEEMVWICPNPNCGSWTYDRKLSCATCGCPRTPDVIRMKLAWSCVNCGMTNIGSTRVCSRCGVGERQLPGDWICPGCKILNFSSNTKCVKCTQMKTAESIIQPQRSSDDSSSSAPNEGSTTKFERRGRDEAILSSYESREESVFDAPADSETLQAELGVWECALCSEKNPKDAVACTRCGITA